MSPKILTLDIETAPNLGYTWAFYEQNVIKIVRPWYVLMVGYKWADESKPRLLSLHQYKGFKRRPQDDSALLKDVWELLDKADIVVTQNGDNFDIKKLNVRFLKLGLPPYTPFKSVDTKKTSKKHFAFINNKLDNLGEELGFGGKMHHEGFPMWEGCMAGNIKDFERMGKYCLRDVVLTERVYLAERPWMSSHPNFTVYTEREGCAKCGSTNTVFRGLGRRVTGKVRQWSCDDCGGWSYDTKTERTTTRK